MAEVKLKPGWFLRDVALAVEQRKCLGLVFDLTTKLTTEELREWHARGLAIIAKRDEQGGGE